MQKKELNLIKRVIYLRLIGWSSGACSKSGRRFGFVSEQGYVFGFGMLPQSFNNSVQ